MELAKVTRCISDSGVWRAASLLPFFCIQTHRGVCAHEHACSLPTPGLLPGTPGSGRGWNGGEGRLSGVIRRDLPAVPEEAFSGPAKALVKSFPVLWDTPPV